MRLAVLALLISVAFGANLDISDNISSDLNVNVNDSKPNKANQNATEIVNPQANTANATTQTTQNQNVPNQNDKNATEQQSKQPQSTQTPKESQTALDSQPKDSKDSQVAQKQTPQESQAQESQPQISQDFKPQESQSTPQPKPKKVAKPRPSDPDERLKEDIINFEREQYFQNNDKIDDPFIYVYQQTEDEIAIRAQLEQAVLTLKSIIVAPDSNNRVKRYKAHINNQWVEECRGTGKNRKCDLVEGWEVTGITKDTVKLRVTRYNMNRDLNLMSRKFKMKKEVNYK